MLDYQSPPGTGIISLDTMDLISLDPYLERGYPQQEWALLRREAPVFWYERDNVNPFWAVTKHADIIAVASQPDSFAAHSASL